MATAIITDRWTAVPKTRDLIGAGVTAAAIPTYNALADHANSTTGECWPMMETLARILGRTAKTIQRHLRLLEEAGLVEVLERRRDGRGRFLGFRFRLPHFARAAARIQERRESNRAAHELKKKERREANEARRSRRAEGQNAGEVSSGHAPGRSSGHTPSEARRERAQERRRGYAWLFDGEPGPKPSEAVTGISSTPSPPMSAGHQSPLDPNKGQTSSGITSPQTPRGGAEDRRTIEEDPATTKGQPASEAPPRKLPNDVEARLQGSEEAVGELSPEHAAWSRVVSAAAEIRGDVDPRELSITDARLEGSTLTVELRDAPIIEWSGLNRREVGRVADRVRRRHGENLRALWREISGNPDAVLDLGGGKER